MRKDRPSGSVPFPTLRGGRHSTLMASFAVILCLLLPGCSHDEEWVAETEVEVGELPVTRYHDSTMLEMFEGSRLSWRMHTVSLEKWQGSDVVKAKPVDLVVNDSLGTPALWVEADSGTVDEQVTFLTARGNVHVRSAKGVQVWTDSLRWNKQSDQVSTEAKVRVVSEEGDELSGRGFISDANLDNWQILNDVKAVFHKVEERLQKWDRPDSGAFADSTTASSGKDAAP